MKLSELKRKYQQNKKPFRKFIRKMDNSKLKAVVGISEEAEKEVWQQVDCLACANCCRKMTPTLTGKDKARIADHLGITKKEFTDKYLSYDKKSKDWQMQVQPCVFLDLETNKCNIYAVRPADCKSFPHLSKKPLESYVYIHSQNIKYCPATYLWVEKMMDRITFS
jgi:hypothetical protein